MNEEKQKISEREKNIKYLKNICNEYETYIDSIFTEEKSNCDYLLSEILDTIKKL